MPSPSIEQNVASAWAAHIETCDLKACAGAYRAAQHAADFPDSTNRAAAARAAENAHRSHERDAKE